MADKHLDSTDLPTFDEDQQVDDTAATSGKPGGSHVAISSMGWKDFLLNPSLFRAISECGFEHPSKVQHLVIPKAISGVDILCQAKSGMGKTAVFVISVIHQNPEPKDLETVVLGNTRELAMQTCKEFKRFTKYLPEIKCETIYGGVPLEEQTKMLKTERPHIICGTPGRMKDLLERGFLDLSHVRFFILDECDRLLEELKMRAQMQYVFMKTPKKKQVMMFSATLSPEIRKVAMEHMHDPEVVIVDEDDKLKSDLPVPDAPISDALLQYYDPIVEKDKNRKLVDLLDNLEFNQCIIFVSEVYRAEALNKLLCSINFPSICTHSNLETAERLARFNEFKEGRKRVLVATELMSRGIDVEFVNVVINYDMARDAKQYHHRVYRAGRFGTKGLAVSFISTKEDKEVLEEVQKRFVVNELPDISEIDPNWYRCA